MQKNPSTPKGEYRCLYYKRNKFTPYTSTKMPYDDYLQTDVWKELRNKRLMIDHYQCKVCGTAINVQVHHIQYPDVWGTESVQDDLVTMCASCHAKTHEYDFNKNNPTEDPTVPF